MAQIQVETPSSNLTLKEVKIIFENRPGGDIVYPLGSPEEMEYVKKQSYTLKEGCQYKTRVTFSVKDEVISGLKSVICMNRKGIRVAKDQQMLGSFGPQAAPHEVNFPRHGWGEAPTGLLSRGSYNSTYKFIDDDGTVQAEWEMAFDIKPEW